MESPVRNTFKYNVSLTDATCVCIANILLLLYKCFLQKDEQEYHSYYMSLEVFY